MNFKLAERTTTACSGVTLPWFPCQYKTVRGHPILSAVIWPLQHQWQCPMFSRIVWLLWMQGWVGHPYIPEKVRQSWVVHNPEFKVVLLDATNVKDHIPEAAEYMFHDSIQTAARSDIARIHLLATHGGVWADASVLCMRPLRSWLDDLHQSLFMYHSGQTSNPYSRFIVASKHSYVMNAWKNATNKYWRLWLGKDGGKDYPYFWMDGLFQDLYRTDSRFAAEWDAVPAMDCTVFGGPAYLHTRHHTLIDDALYAKLIMDPPNVLKLSVHGSPQQLSASAEAALPNTTSHAAIRVSLGKTAVVIAHYNEPQVCINATLAIIRRHIAVIDVYFYTKGERADNFSYHVCRKLENVGREGETYVRFILEDFEPHNYTYVLFTQACAHSSLEEKLQQFRAGDTRVLNLGGYEPGTCDGTSAFPMRRLREMWALRFLEFCPADKELKMAAYMGGQFLAASSTVAADVPRHLWHSIHRGLLTYSLSDDIALIADDNNRERLATIQSGLNANYFSFELERAWSFLLDCAGAEHCQWGR